MGAKVIALGFFDGVHIGHGALLTRARERADQLGVAAAAMTFDIHPETVVFGRKLPLINTMADRELFMKDLYGMDQVIFAHFDKVMMEMPWEEFVKDYLIGQLEAVHVVCGHDYTFGYKGLGTAEKLAELCRELGLGCDIIPKVTLEGITVSSTHIRDLIEDGAMEAAARFLGHPHRISGTVIKGHQLGRTIGIPTANIALDPGIIEPAHGVYAAKAVADGREYMAVTNVGVRPTVDSSGVVTVEPYIIDFQGDLYGKCLTLELYQFLRPESKFASLQELQAAIQENVRQTQELFNQ